MECDDVRACLHALVDAELPEDRAAVVEHHLAACPSCAEAREHLFAARRALAEFPVPAAAATDPEHIRRLARPRPAGVRSRWKVAAALAAGISLFLFLRVEVQRAPGSLTLSLARRGAAVEGGGAAVTELGRELRRLERRLAELEGRHEEDLRALAWSLGVSTKETEQRASQDLERLRDTMEQELLLARGAMAELVAAVAPGLSRALVAR